MVRQTDVNPNQGHLLIPFNQIVEKDFLNEAELNIIDEHQRGNSKKGVDGTKLKDKVGHILRLWSFHSQDGTKLYLAFFHQPPAPDMPQPQAQDQHPDQAMHTASSSSMALERDSGNLGQVIVDLNQPLVQDMAPLEDVQERHDSRTSAVYFHLGIGPQDMIAGLHRNQSLRRRRRTSSSGCGFN
ncbi:hypothetical protein Bca101_036147 [Brassica carinata]